MELPSVTLLLVGIVGRPVQPIPDENILRIETSLNSPLPNVAVRHGRLGIGVILALEREYALWLKNATELIQGSLVGSL